MRGMKRKKSWGFDTGSIDRSVRPQDDFFHYANGNWMKRNPIPKDEARWGTFMILGREAEGKLHAILKETADKTRVSSGSPERRIRDLYRSGMDMKRRNALGAKPLTPLLTPIDWIRDVKDLVSVITRLHQEGITVLWNFFVDQDSKNSERYAFHLSQDGLGMPDRDYYLRDGKEFLRVRKAYEAYVARMFRLLGYAPKRARAAAVAVLRIETELANVSMPKEDVRDVEKTYHKKTIEELARRSPVVNWKRYLRAIGAGAPSSLIVSQPKFMEESGRLLSSAPLSDWKEYLRFHVANSSASLLSDTFVRAQFDFYAKALMGNKRMKPLWRRVLRVVNGNLGDALGKLYVARHFSPHAKREVGRLVDNLFIAYEERVRNLDWMSVLTKKKAIAKLRMMTRKLGYPKRFKTYRGLVIRPDDYFGNAVRAGKHHLRREMRKLKKPVDRTEWFMSPQTVNAYCNFNMNEIVFPAAILQPPFFDADADDAVNYGAIGSVIGHEITHALDDQGSKFDGKGTMRRWWTPRDRKRFDAKGRRLIRQFDAYKVAPDMPVNGRLTLGENIADLGGTAIALDAYIRSLKRAGKRTVGGFTPEQRFFLGLAQAFREIVRPEFLKTMVTTDPHSPEEFRVNGPASNSEAFYEAFGVTKKDKLYRKPSDRAKIW